MNYGTTLLKSRWISPVRFDDQGHSDLQGRTSDVPFEGQLFDRVGS